VEEGDLAADKSTAAALGGWIVFEDECGQSLRPPGRRPGDGAGSPRSSGSAAAAPGMSRSPGWPATGPATASWELLTRQVRSSAPADDSPALREVGDGKDSAASLTVRDAAPRSRSGNGSAPPREVQRQAWRWALANRAGDGTLPAGSEIARQYGRRERWGRLVKSAGLAGELTETLRTERQST
jgi:hypothetical protein